MKNFRWKMIMIMALVSFPGIAWTDTGHEGTKRHQMPQMNDDNMPGMMREGMLAMPQMDPARGRALFASKGCVVCHSVNGIGGDDAPALDASSMPLMMNPFEFAAKMWRGAEAMVALQREELDETIELTGQELADIIAFVHSHKEQAIFSIADVPERMKKLMDHSGAGEHHYGVKD
jgi:cytochrome c|tara:strand:- start:62 stop:589 length:528 start_codon:yes stop_codon:yes gene_type:complete